MNSVWIHVIHQAVFGSIAAAGFGILFNCPPRIIVYCLGSGAVTLAIRTACQAAGVNLPEAAFFAALAVAAIERVLQRFQHVRGSIVALVGCIPMIPGSMVARGWMNLFALRHAHSGGESRAEIAAAVNGMRNLLEVTLTLAAIGTALAIPYLIYPEKKPALS